MQAPYAAQDASEIGQLVRSLEAASKKGGGKHEVRCKKHTYDVEGTNLTVDSWQYRDWDYKRRDLPTYARGLFTYRGKGGQPEIAARGYDKFFNVGEVANTEWKNVENETKGPYELSVKENGCIIFISGLEGDHLLVCSKHSTGPRDNANLSHAVAGERWVDKHLSLIGKGRSDLARELRKRNVTAVAELCDDQFEEHVLAYEPKDAGLYLHGLNLNLPEFATYPGELVHQFADQWGFKKAHYTVMNDVSSMRSFLADCAETGSYDGRDTEGFVIRCDRRHGKVSTYQNWFFKYKFEEPYLMYRQWRECTKAVIAKKPPRFKKHKRITEEYLLYARRQLAANPGLATEYNKNHGIIAMRDGFLKERGLNGAQILQQEERETSSDAVDRNLVLLPIATIGCGKTTVALALTKLFDWGHIQNDNITGKRNRPQQFTSLVCTELASHPVCIGDRNNHQRRERKQIINDVLSFVPDAKFVALHYVHDPKSEMLPQIRKVTQERIFARGDNHQTIQADSKSRQEITGIMEGFLNRFEGFNGTTEPDDAFDCVVDLDVMASSRENLEHVVQVLYNQYPKLIGSMPSGEDLDEAIDAALKDYRPDIKHDLSFKSDKGNRSKPDTGKQDQPKDQANGSPKPLKPPKLEYFSVRLDPSIINSVLSKAFSSGPPDISRMYHQLEKTRRIQPKFHVTLIHRASIPVKPELWQKLSAIHAHAVSEAAQAGQPTFDPQLGTCRVRLERLVWDNRVMCIVARLLDEGWESVNELPHVTIGTAAENIKPRESNDLLKKWLAEGAGIMEKEIEGFMEVTGEVRAVMSKFA